MPAFRTLRLTSLVLLLILVGIWTIRNTSRSQTAGQELFVPGDCAQIQKCIDQAQPGATLPLIGHGWHRRPKQSDAEGSP